jgi:hypothetical protein
MPRGKLRLWRYLTDDGEVHTFYAPTVVLADKYAKRWARKQGYRKLKRLRRK